MKQIRAQQHDTVDAICHREYGYTARVTEQTLALPENRGLADLGPVLPQAVSYTHLTLPTKA